MRIVIAFVLMSVLLASFANAQERVSEKQLIQAFLDCPEIIKAQKEFGDKGELGKPSIVLHNSLCGAAGCQYSALVAQKHESERRKANPMTTHILGLVHVGPKGDIVLVERVELIPFSKLKETLGNK
jgi:hypothetical protein